MPATNNSNTQDSSTDPQVKWPKPPMMRVITAGVALIAFLCILMTIKLFEISNELKIMNGNGRAATSNPANISHTSLVRNANH